MTNHNPPGEIPLEQNPAFEPELVETGFLDLFLVKPAIVYRHGNAPEACAKVGCIGHDGSYPIPGNYLGLAVPVAQVEHLEPVHRRALGG